MRMLFLAFGLAGAALLILACVLGYGKYHLVRDGTRSTGQVVAYFDSQSATEVTDPKPSHGHIFSPVVEFEGPTGAPVRFTASTGGASPEPKVGTAVEVLYPRDRPAEAILAEPQAIWGLTAAAAAFGLPFLLLGIFGNRFGG
jgi:hypothetical protein